MAVASVPIIPALPETVQAAAGPLGTLWRVASTAYNAIVILPLRKLYFEGPIWRNQRPEDICFQLTKVSADHWRSTPANMGQCLEELEKNFASWSTTATYGIYFSLLTLFAVRLFCCFCCCGLPHPWPVFGHLQQQQQQQPPSMTVAEFRALIAELRAQKIVSRNPHNPD